MSHNVDSNKESKNEISPDNMPIIFMLSSLISDAMGPLNPLIYDKIHFRS